MPVSKTSSIAREVLNVCTDHNKRMHPRRFCRRWYGLENVRDDGRNRYTEAQIVAMESERGYREKCINLIARILKVKTNTIHRWGKGVNFDKIPADKQEQYESYLGYVDALRTITVNLSVTNEAALVSIYQELKSSNRLINESSSRSAEVTQTVGPKVALNR